MRKCVICPFQQYRAQSWPHINGSLTIDSNGSRIRSQELIQLMVWFGVGFTQQEPGCTGKSTKEEVVAAKSSWSRLPPCKGLTDRQCNLKYLWYGVDCMVRVTRIHWLREYLEQTLLVRNLGSSWWKLEVPYSNGHVIGNGKTTCFPLEMSVPGGTRKINWHKSKNVSLEESIQESVWKSQCEFFLLISL